MLISPENKSGFFVERHEVIAVAPSSGFGGECYMVFLRDGRSFTISTEQGGELLKRLK